MSEQKQEGYGIYDTAPHSCHNADCSGTCRYIGPEYGSLADGGSYEEWRCDKCGKRTWIGMPD